MNISFQREQVQGDILCLRKIIIAYINISSPEEKTSTAWKILVTENKIEILKDHFITDGQSGKIIGIKECIWKILQNLSHELLLNYLPHSKPIFGVEHSSNNFNKLKSWGQCYSILVQQIELKDKNFSGLSHLCLTARQAQNHSQTITVFFNCSIPSIFQRWKSCTGYSWTKFGCFRDGGTSFQFHHSILKPSLTINCKNSYFSICILHILKKHKKRISMFGNKMPM